jgi:hypothetical protein
MQVLLLNILWVEDSPYGTYLQDDSIDCYFDTSTDLPVVKKNGVVITSGADIPLFFTYNAQSSFFYKSEKIVQGQICDGTSLLQFQRATAFPYLTYTLYLNHVSCDIINTVCDLQFNLLATITDASSATALDGTLTVLASGSNANVKYKLNADFEYNDGTGQTSGTFTGLSRGTYVIFARDSTNCLANMSVTIGITKTYGILNRLEFYSVHSNLHQKTEILQDGYAGSVIEVKGSDNPTIYRLRGEGDKDKFFSFSSGELEVSIVSETNYQHQSLFTNDPEKFRIKHSVDFGSGYETVFLGKLLPNQYQEQYISTPYFVSVIASCGLPSLADVSFLDSDGNQMFGQYSQIKLIAWILNKIGLGLQIRSACNIYAVTMDSTAADDPLDQAYVDVARYYLINPKPSCIDVLTWMLEPYGAEIVQWGGYWNILRKEERIAAFDYRVFDTNGDYVSNSSYNPIKDVKLGNQSNRIVWANRDQGLIINSGFGKINLSYNLGRKDNLLENGNFQLKKYTVYNQPVISGNGILEGSVPDITGFELVNNGTVITRTSETIEDDNVAFGMEVTEAGGYLVSDVIGLSMLNSDQLHFTLNYKVVCAQSTSTRYCKVKCQINFGGYYLMEDGNWTTVEQFVNFFVKPEEYNTYIKKTIKASSPFGGAERDLFVSVYCAYIYHAEFSSIAALVLKPTVDLATGYRTEVLTGGSLFYYELQESTNTNDGIHIVRPTDYSNRQWIRVGGVTVGTSTTTLFIDEVNLTFYSRGKKLPEIAAYRQSMENKNNLVLNKILYHGSLLVNWQTLLTPGTVATPVSKWLDQVFNVDVYIPANFQNAGFENYQAISAGIVYSGYLRDVDGVGYTTWSRSGITERKSIEQIYMDMYSAQYNLPWRMINGSFIGDILFTPIDTINETMDDDSKYFANSLEIDFKHDAYQSSLMELSDYSEAVGFTTGFTTGFNA